MVPAASPIAHVRRVPSVTRGDAGLISIGVLNEKPLHVALKLAYARPGDRLEARVGPYIVDILRGEQVIEIQTANLAAIKRKILTLVEGHDVLLVVPIAVRRSIVRLSDDGTTVSTRRSPKRGAVTDVFDGLVSFPELVCHPRFVLEVALTSEEEVRVSDARRGWRQKGWATDHRRLVAVDDRVRIDGVAALIALVPTDLPEPFTTADLAHALGRPRLLAQRMAYCLARAGAIVPVGKTGNTVRYMSRRLDG